MLMSLRIAGARLSAQAPAGRLVVLTALAGGLVLPLGATHASSPTHAPAPQAQASKAESSIQQINDAFVQRIAGQIAGHEQEPASKVFKNIQYMNTTPAGRLLLIMNVGYSRGLGVTCTHCHVEQDFSLDDKRPKRAAREMATMHRLINEQLAKMKSLEPTPQGHFINCSTCHRGGVDPLASDK